MVIETGNLIANRYKVLSILGEGGAGVVYHVEDTGVTFQRRELALKVLDERYYDNKEVLSRFQNELLITEQFSHENIVRAGSFEHVDGLYFITMEYVKGQNVKELLQKSPGGLTLQYALKILYHVADALEYAHKKGIIHRDIKPDNILLSESGDIKVSDFGIARPLENYQALTVQDDFVGTRTYMSPEQLRSSQEIDYRTDIYSLGIVAFELLTGHPPFEAESEFVLSNMHCKSPIPSIAKDTPGVPSWYQSFIEKCCEKDPARRFKSMGDVCKLLSLHLQDSPDQSEGSIVQKKGGHSSLPALFLHTKLYIERRRGMLKAFLIAAFLGYLNFYFQFPITGLPYSGEAGNTIEPQAFDIWFPLRDKFFPLNRPEQTTIIYVDSTSYTKLGANLLKPFPRKHIIDALNGISDLNPKRLVLDMVVLDNSSGHESREVARHAEVEAQKLASEFSKFDTYVARTRILQTEDTSTGQRVYSDSGLRSAELFLKNVKGEFYANLHASRGVIRYFYHGEFDWYIPTPMSSIVYQDGLRQDLLPDIGEYINYYAKTNGIKSIPLYRVIEDDYDKELIRDKFVFIGRKPDPTSEKDTFYTPYGTKIPGVEIHATILSNIVNQEWIRRLPRGLEKFLVIAFTTLICFLIITSEPRTGLILTSVLAVGSFATSFYLFLTNFYFPGLITLPIILLLTYLVVHVALLQRVYQFLENIGFERQLK